MSIPSKGIIANRLADKKEGLRCVLDRLDVGGIGEFMSNNLSIELRLLHHIVGRIFLPKIGRFDFVLKIELVVMSHVLLSIPMNLAMMMLV